MKFEKGKDVEKFFQKKKNLLNKYQFSIAQIFFHSFYLWRKEIKLPCLRSFFLRTSMKRSKKGNAKLFNALFRTRDSNEHKRFVHYLSCIP